MAAIDQVMEVLPNRSGQDGRFAKSLLSFAKKFLDESTGEGNVSTLLAASESRSEATEQAEWERQGKRAYGPSMIVRR